MFPSLSYHNECQATNVWDHNLILLQCKHIIEKIQWDMLLNAAILKSKPYSFFLDLSSPHIITCSNASCNIFYSQQLN